MPSFSDSANQGAPSGWLNGVDWKHIGFVFLVSFLGFVATFLTSFLIPYLQDHGLISVAVGTAFATAIAAFLRLINDGTKTARLVLIGLSVSLLSGATTLADDTAVLVDSSQPKSYILTIDAGGNVTLSPLKAVVRPGPSPTPIPPTPGPLTERAKAIMAAAQKVPTTGTPADPNRGETAKGLAELFRQMASITPQATSAPALEAALKMGLDSFLSSRGPTAPQAWQPVRDLIGSQLTVLDFSKAPLADYATLFGEVANGLDASAPGSRGISPQMLQLILQIVQIILALFKIPVPPLPTP